MIPYYFDNASTTLIKPPSVAQGVAYAVNNFGNGGRGHYLHAQRAQREIYSARQKIAALVGVAEALNVAFTASFTDGLNMLVTSLLKPGDQVITTLTEHNSVLRPLYLRGCRLLFLECDPAGRVMVEGFTSLVTPLTRAVFVNHASNVTGFVAQVRQLCKLCRREGVPLVLDVSQSFGHVPLDEDCADIFVFTGHKGLFGPQGTGGIIVNGDFGLKIARTGGTGSDTFKPLQAEVMPDLFEAGTLNAPGIYGLGKGADFITEVGLGNISRVEARLVEVFVEMARAVPGLWFCGAPEGGEGVPVVSVNLGRVPSGEVALYLWERHGIAVRCGTHCAPLIHKHLGTAEQGAVRFSFSYFNTLEEVGYAGEALRQAAGYFGLGL